MARLIDLDELLKFPIRIDHCDKEHGNMDFVYGIETVLEYAEYLPIIDAEPVTRCGNCIHRVKGTWAKCHGRRPWEFCSDGERRTDERKAD